MKEIKDTSVAYVTATDQTRAAQVAGSPAESGDPRAEERAARFRKPFATSDDEVRRLISADWRIMHGVPCIAGTRIPVYMIVSLIEEGYTFKRILKLYPHITEGQIKAALRYAVNALEDWA